MNLGEALLHALREHGACELFGLPGDFALPLFDVIESSGLLPLYTLSHEPAVGFAADAAARIRSGLGVAVVTYGAGALNLLNATAAAYAEKSPVVVISGAPGNNEGRRGLLLHHQAKTLESQARIFAEVTCAQARLDDLSRAPAEIARVLKACRSLSRPVYLEVPRDLVSSTCERVNEEPPDAPDREAVESCAQGVLERLKEARAPVLVIGVEVRRFGLEAKVAELARRMALPIVTSLLGRGLLAGDEQLLGTYLGQAGSPEIAELVEGSDAPVLLGVILSDTNLGISSRRVDMRRTIQALDGHVALGHHVYPQVPLTALVDALLANLGTATARAITAPRPRPAQYRTGLIEDDSALHPSDVATALNDLIAANGRLPIAADMGDCLFTTFEVTPTEFVAPGYYASMGFAVPAGIGIQAATGVRPLVLVGDGAFQMTGFELGNCRRYGLDPIVVVFNNQGWETLRAFQPHSRFNDLDDWHFAELASALGGDGSRVRTRRELANALRGALGRRGRFQLIEVMLARGDRSPTLAQFVAALTKPRPAPG